MDGESWRYPLVPNLEGASGMMKSSEGPMSADDAMMALSSRARHCELDVEIGSL